MVQDNNGGMLLKIYIFLIDDSAAESFNGNETVGHSSNASEGTHCREMAETNSNGKTNLEQDEQPLNLSDSPLSAQLTSEYRLDDHNSNGKNKYKNLLIPDLKMEQEARENGSKVRFPFSKYAVFSLGKGSINKTDPNMVMRKAHNGICVVYVASLPK